MCLESNTYSNRPFATLQRLSVGDASGTLPAAFTVECQNLEDPHGESDGQITTWRQCLIQSSEKPLNSSPDPEIHD